MNGGALTYREAAARHRYSQQYTVNWKTGKRTSLPLNNIGYLSEIQIVGDITVVIAVGGTTPTDTDAAKYNWLPYIGLRSPQGTQVWSTNSRDLFAFNFRLTKSVQPSGDPAWVMPTYGTPGTYNVHFRLRIPVSANDGRNFDMGMLMRQISNNQFFLDIQMAAASDVVGTGTNFSITDASSILTVEEIYYDAVIQGSNVQPPNFQQYLRLRSLQSNALVNGQNDLRYDTGPVIADAMFLAINNSAFDANAGGSSSANLTQIQLLANKGNNIDTRTGNRLVYDNYMHLGKALPGGWTHEDYFDDLEEVNATLGRDLINSALAAQLDFMYQYSGTPAGTSYIEQFFREIVTLGA